MGLERAQSHIRTEIQFPVFGSTTEVRPQDCPTRQSLLSCMLAQCDRAHTDPNHSLGRHSQAGTCTEFGVGGLLGVRRHPCVQHSAWTWWAEWARGGGGRGQVRVWWLIKAARCTASRSIAAVYTRARSP
jgi:hypothetical protein